MQGLGLRTGNTLVAKDEEQREIERRAIESIQKKNTIRTGAPEKNNMALENQGGNAGMHIKFLTKMKCSEDDLKSKLMSRVKDPEESEDQHIADLVPEEPKITAIPKSKDKFIKNQSKKTTSRC